jgi:hypothetical protein
VTAAAYADDRSEICGRGHSQTLRLPEREYYALRNAAFARAGIPTSMQCHEGDSRPDCLVMDHIVPLELCLASDDCNRLDNIQIQTRGAAEAKDRLENDERWRFCRREETRPQAISHFKRSAP